MENSTWLIQEHKHRTRRRRVDLTTRRILADQPTPKATMAQVKCHRVTFKCFKRPSPLAVPENNTACELKPTQGPIDAIERFSCNMKPSAGRLCQITHSKLLTFCCLALISVSAIEGSHHNQQQFASYSSNTNQAAQQANRNVTVLLDTTEQSSLGWTRYPDGGPSGQGRTPGWSEESFLNVDKDINWRSFVTCDVAYESVNNWLWTPYLERGDANRLYIEIKFTMRDCNLFPQMVRSCRETFALLYNEVDGPIQAPTGQNAANVSFAHADEYKLVDAIAADNGRFTSNGDVVINTEVKSVPVSKRGVYFAFRDQGACLSLIAIKVYSLSCPQLTTNLARFNSTPVGSDPGGLVAVEGECVANSIQIEQPRMFCTLAGTWNTVTSGQCKCLAGFEPVQNHTKCQACPPGRFKPLAGDSPCLPCPDKSHSSQTGAIECKCYEGYFRAPKDARTQACSQPPSGPAQNLTAIHVDSTSAILQWQPPRSNSISGGHQRDDLTYKLLCDSCDFTTIASSPQFFSNFSETKCVLSGLQPATSYRFMLYVANGVSLMAAMSNHHYAQQQTFSEITIQTSKATVQTQSNTLSSQNGLQLLPIYNFRTFAGARGSDMVLAWDSQQQQSLMSPSSGGLFQSADSLLDSTTGLPIDQQQQQLSLYEIKFQPRHLNQPQEQLMLARRSPYPLFDQQQQQQHLQQQQLSMAQQQQSMTTTIKALGVYTLQPRIEYAFQIRAKWGHTGQWTDWSEPIFAKTAAGSSVSNNNNQLAINYQPSMFQEPPNFPLPIPNDPSWPPQSPFLQSQPPQTATSSSSWLSSVALVLLCSLIISILVAVTLVHYRNSMCLKSLSSSLSGGLMGSNVGSTYAGVYNGGTSSDLIAGVGNGNPLSGNYGSSQATSGGNGASLIYHNAPAIAGLHHHHHLHTTLSAGSNGQLITGSNSTSRSSSGASNVVQSFLAATLGQLAGHNNHNNNNHQHLNHSHISAKTLDVASSQQHSKLFLGSNNRSNQLGGRDHSPSHGLFDTQTSHNQHNQRNHYHQMLGNVNHTLLFSNNNLQQTGPLIPGQYQQQPVPIVPSNNGAGHHHNLAQHLSNLQQQQQLANGNSPQPPQVADLFIGHQNLHHHQQQQQSKYSNSRTLSGQQQQYGLANLHDPQVHIYDDLEVVSQSNQMDCSGEMLKFGQQQQFNKQTANRHQQAAIYAASRELYEPTTKLVIGSNGQQQQPSLNLSNHHNQQQQARAKFYKERAEDEFHDDNDK